MPPHFFVTHNANWQKSNQKNFLLKESPSIIEVQNGIVLPPKRRLKIKKGQSSWAGGVCDSNGKWLAGLNRYQAFEKRAFGFGDCVGAYAFQKRKLHFHHESVIFGGILMGQFGHFLLDSMARFWYFLRNQNDERRIAFLKCEGWFQGGFSGGAISLTIPIGLRN